jgi:hypothetical protein
MEEWKDVKGFEDYYEVSNLGNVRSKDRVIIQKNGRFHRRKGKNLNTYANKNNGLFQVMLVIHKRMKLVYVHRLVAQAFVQNPYNLDIVTHIDGNYNNNRADNLMWISRSMRENKRLKLF